MTRVRWAVVVACFTLLGSQFSEAQRPSQSPAAPPQQSIESLLASGDPRLLAWGAHNALVANRRDLIPELLSLAAQWEPIVLKDPDAWDAEDALPQEELDRRDGMQAVLDTLIQMHAPVPAETVRTIAADFGHDAGVLLSRMPLEQALPLAGELYKSLPRNPPLRYITAATLAQHPPPGFAAELLREVDVYAFVDVQTPGAEQWSGAVSQGDCMAHGTGHTRKNWPLTGQYMLHWGYTLDGRAKQQAILLVGGIDPVYATREQSGYYYVDRCGRAFDVGLGGEKSRNLLAEMLGTSPNALRWQARLEVYMEFRSLQQFHTELAAFVAKEQARYRATAAALAARNLMTSAEAHDCLPTITLWVTDWRQDRGALPDLKPQSLPTGVEWKKSGF
jgi:hypothetical protein